MTFTFTTVQTGNYILAVYKYIVGGPHVLMFSTSMTAIPTVAGRINTPISNIIDGCLDSSNLYYSVIFLDVNGSNAIGMVMGSTSTIKPSRNIALATLGSLTSAPSTIIDGSESSNGTPWFGILR